MGRIEPEGVVRLKFRGRRIGVRITKARQDFMKRVNWDTQEISKEAIVWGKGMGSIV